MGLTFDGSTDSLSGVAGEKAKPVGRWVDKAFCDWLYFLGEIGRVVFSWEERKAKRVTGLRRYEAVVWDGPVQTRARAPLRFLQCVHLWTFLREPCCGLQLLQIHSQEASVSEEGPLDNRLPLPLETKAGSTCAKSELLVSPLGLSLLLVCSLFFIVKIYLLI